MVDSDVAVCLLESGKPELHKIVVINNPLELRNSFCIGMHEHVPYTQFAINDRIQPIPFV